MFHVLHTFCTCFSLRSISRDSVQAVCGGTAACTKHTTPNQLAALFSSFAGGMEGLYPSAIQEDLVRGRLRLLAPDGRCRPFLIYAQTAPRERARE